MTAMNYGDRNAAALDTYFQGRVKIGVVKLCNYIIASEQPTAPNHDARSVLARSILRNPDIFVLGFSYGVVSASVADPAGSAAEINDAAIDTALQTNFNNYLPTAS